MIRFQVWDWYQSAKMDPKVPILSPSPKFLILPSDTTEKRSQNVSFAMHILHVFDAISRCAHFCCPMERIRPFWIATASQPLTSHQTGNFRYHCFQQKSWNVKTLVFVKERLGGEFKGHCLLDSCRQGDPQRLKKFLTAEVICLVTQQSMDRFFSVRYIWIALYFGAFYIQFRW